MPTGRAQGGSSPAIAGRGPWYRRRVVEGTSSPKLAFEAVRLALARLHVLEGDDFDSATRRALELSARALRVERVGVWRFRAGRAALDCRLLYSQSGEVGPGEVLLADHFPRYWRSLEQNRAIVASDARHDEVTSELWQPYLEPLGITSLLDAPIYRAGELIGVVCHEHVGPPRTWTPDEIAFACSVGDLLAMLYEQAERVAADAELRARAFHLVSAEKLAVLEQLASSVAHDVNNVLTAVVAVAGCLARPQRDDAELIETLHACAATGTRLVEQLRRFGDRSATRDRQIPIGEIVHRIQPILYTLVRHTAALVVEVEVPDDATAAMPSDELEQIILNLCLNARDAIDGYGEIKLAVRDDGEHLVLVVTDNGCGIPPEVLPQIWKAYFTTKATGTGLGLATIRGIAEANGIAIDVASEQGRGTTFELRLPRLR
jgi:two-component system cell cycle sensor histidine kinase/response regulator CckA